MLNRYTMATELTTGIEPAKDCLRRSYPPLGDDSKNVIEESNLTSLGFDHKTHESNMLPSQGRVPHDHVLSEWPDSNRRPRASKTRNLPLIYTLM